MHTTEHAVTKTNRPLHFCRAPVHCTLLRTVVIMCMMPCGLQHTRLCLLVWTWRDVWTCGTSTMIQKYTHTYTHIVQASSENFGVKNPFFFFQVPTASVYVEGGTALNRVRWAHSGKEIATGDSEGQVQVYDVGEVRRVPRPLPWSPFCFSCRPHPSSSRHSKSACPRRMSGRASSGLWRRSTRIETRLKSWRTLDAPVFT